MFGKACLFIYIFSLVRSMRGIRGSGPDMRRMRTTCGMIEVGSGMRRMTSSGLGMRGMRSMGGGAAMRYIRALWAW